MDTNQLNSLQKEFENELKVFLPPKYHSVIDQLYEQTTKKDQ